MKTPTTQELLSNHLVRPLASLLAASLLCACFDPGTDDSAETSTSSSTGGNTETGSEPDSTTNIPEGSTSGDESTTGESDESTGTVVGETDSEETGSFTSSTSGSDTGESSSSDSGSTGDDTTGCVALDWYPDTDEDGFGDADGVVSACEAPDGYVDNGDDCDDTTELRNPDAIEICDGLDNDCDDALDEWSALNPTCGGCEMQLQAGSVYAYCLGSANFEDAEAACAAQGTSLVRIESQLENDLLTETAGEIANGDYTIGLMLDGEDWVWTDAEAVTFEAWRPGAPDSGDDCAELDTLDSGFWNDIPCTATTSTVGWICEGTP